MAAAAVEQYYLLMRRMAKYRRTQRFLKRTFCRRATWKSSPICYSPYIGLEFSSSNEITAVSESTLFGWDFNGFDVKLERFVYKIPIGHLKIKPFGK